MSRTFGLVRISRPLLDLTTPLMQGRKILWAQLSLRWAEIVGEKWATQTRPERLTLPTERTPRGTLHVMAWGRNNLELAYEAPYFCEKVNQYFGFAAVHLVKWRSVLKAPATPAIPYRHPPLSLSSVQREWVQEKTCTVQGDLGQALTALGESILQDSRRR